MPDCAVLSITVEYGEAGSCLSLHIVSITNIQLLVNSHAILYVSLVNRKLESRRKHSVDLILKTQKGLLKVDRKFKFDIAIHQIADTLLKVISVRIDRRVILSH